MESANEIERRAAAWLARRDGDGWTATDEAALRQWLEQATAHRVAYLRLEMVWKQSERLQAFAAGLPPGSGEKTDWTLPSSFGPQESAAPVVVRRRPALRHLRLKACAVAAAVLLVIGAVHVQRELYPGSLYTTQIGVITTVPLADGSSIVMNTASRIRVALNTQQRRIDLVQGEAFFEVAKDASRPFMVTVGDQRVVAVGTKFSVRREGNQLRVVVTEGKVRIERNDRTVDIEPTGGLLLTAGGIANTTTEGLVVRQASIAQSEETLSWRTGYLTFRDTPLSDAVHEFNKYNRQQLAVSDPQVAGILLTGKFKPTNYDAFVRLLEDGYGIRARQAGETTVLIR